MALRTVARAAALAAAVTAAAASAAPDVAAVANLSGAQTPMTFPMLDCVGSAHAEMGMWAVWRQHVAMAARDIGFAKIRFHGSLDDDMSTFLGGHANLAALRDLWSFLASVGMKPIVELSFTPADLASEPNSTFMHYRANISPPKDFGLWTAFITELVAGAVSIFGIDVVRTWQFEVYNEPNCGFYTGNQSSYFQLYAATAAGIKAVDPLIPVGGPSTCQLGWIPEFLAFVNASGTPLDFISSHLYPTDKQPAPNTEGFADYVKIGAANVSTMAPAGTPFVMTEFNAGLGINQDDTSYSAAFVIHNHFSLQGVANLPTLSYWAVSDVFEEGGFEAAPWHNGYGITTNQGVPKPVYRAFEMLAALPPASVPVTVSAPAAGAGGVTRRPASITTGTVDIAVAVDDVSSPPSVAVTALLVNHAFYTLPIAAQTVQLTFSGIPAGAVIAANATVDVIDATHANAQPVWVAAGSPTYPTAEEVAAELEASALAPTPVPLAPAGAGAVAVTLTLQPQSVTRVRFVYRP
jgi:xylan 1,4-beta-xylosidase